MLTVPQIATYKLISYRVIKIKNLTKKRNLNNFALSSVLHNTVSNKIQNLDDFDADYRSNYYE